MTSHGSVGEIALESLRQNPETDWFPLGYDLFSFEDAVSYRRLVATQAQFGHFKIHAFIGTWCPDCQDHLPGFARILDTIKFPRDRLHVYALDRNKTYPGGADLIAKHAIHRLPTFLVLRDGQEIGRITETPVHSLIKDMAAIFSVA